MNVGGPAVIIGNLMKALSVNGVEVQLLTGRCDKDEIEYLLDSEIEEKVIRFDGLGRKLNLFGDIASFLQVRRAIKDFNPHIIHTHAAKAGVIGRLASFTTRNKQIRVHTFHGHLLYGYFGPIKTKLIILTERVLAFITHALIAVGDQVKSELIENGIGNRSKFACIPPGVRHEALPSRHEALRNLSLPNHAFTLTWIGRLVEVKRPDRILEIARELEKRNSQIRILVVGNGPLMKDLRESSSHITGQIEFLGWKRNIKDILAVSDVILLTSDNEGMPVALIEAQMAGIPVIATKVGSTHEIIEDGVTGFCKDFDAHEFSLLVHRLFDDNILIREFAANALKRSQNVFSVEMSEIRHRELYFHHARDNGLIFQ
jgi:glycosyltransferase involved in cell wall biosynthesis